MFVPNIYFQMRHSFLFGIKPYAKKSNESQSNLSVKIGSKFKSKMFMHFLLIETEWINWHLWKKKNYFGLLSNCGGQIFDCNRETLVWVSEWVRQQLQTVKMGFTMHCVIFQLPINTQSNSGRFSSEQNKQSRNLQ